MVIYVIYSLSIMSSSLLTILKSTNVLIIAECGILPTYKMRNDSVLQFRILYVGKIPRSAFRILYISFHFRCNRLPNWLSWRQSAKVPSMHSRLTSHRQSIGFRLVNQSIKTRATVMAAHLFPFTIDVLPLCFQCVVPSARRHVQVNGIIGTRALTTASIHRVLEWPQMLKCRKTTTNWLTYSPSPHCHKTFA